MSEEPSTDNRLVFEAAERRRQDPDFKRHLRTIIQEDQELLARLAGG